MRSSEFLNVRQKKKITLESKEKKIKHAQFRIFNARKKLKS
jgi:hypothetical protein